MDKYSDKTAASIWSDHHKYALWTKIETTVLRMVHGIDVVDTSVCPPLFAVKQAEEETGHEMGGFLLALEDRLPDDAKRWIHHGMTSSDVQDTAHSIMLMETRRYLEQRIQKIVNAVQSDRFKVQVQGYTHGQPASPTTITNRFLAAVDAMVLSDAPLPGMISGAVGTHPVVTPQQENAICRELGLSQLDYTTQVIPRREFTDEAYSWVRLTQACAQIATDVRLMSAFGDVSESAQRVGSSAMPHKVNPILSERICGLATLARHLHAALLDVETLWLDRDLHHSSVDRVVYPQLAELTAYVLNTTSLMLNRLGVHPRPLDPVASNSEGWTISATQLYDAPRSRTYAAVRDAVRSMGGWRDE